MVSSIAKETINKQDNFILQKELKCVLNWQCINPLILKSMWEIFSPMKKRLHNREVLLLMNAKNTIGGTYKQSGMFKENGNKKSTCT